ncbi:hypothetical protein D3C79_1031090 [compost metagenome]
MTTMIRFIQPRMQWLQGMGPGSAIGCFHHGPFEGRHYLLGEAGGGILFRSILQAIFESE